MKKQRPAINVQSINQSGGITAHTVIQGGVRRELTDDNIRLFTEEIPDKETSIEVICVWGDVEAFETANKLLECLREVGYKSVSGVDQAIYDRPLRDVVVHKDMRPVEIRVGAVGST